MAKEKHVAENIVVALDFDGTIAYNVPLRVWYAARFYGAHLRPEQALWENFPLGKKKYEQMVREVNTTYALEQPLAPLCKPVLLKLYKSGFRFSVVTSRKSEQAKECRNYIRHHGLPIKEVHVHATNHTPKDYLVKKLHARAMLDDGLYNLRALMGASTGLFFLRQPWNVHEVIRNAEKSFIRQLSGWKDFFYEMLKLKELHEAVCYFKTWENSMYSVQKISEFVRSHPQESLNMLEEYINRR